MARADILVGGTVNCSQRSSQSSYIVQTPSGVIYAFFYAQVDNNLYWIKSTDGGFTWTDAVLIKALGSNAGFTVWYDKWTPGDTGTKVHLAYFESTTDDVLYRALDTNDDSLGTEVTIFAGASTGTGSNTCISITKAIGGNIYVAFDIDGGTETGFYRSTDSGASFTARTDINEATSDYYLLAPGFAADTQDIICIFWDRSASEISRKLYDDSANSWGETSIATSMTAVASSTCAPQFSIAVDDANNKIILIAWTNRDTANADLLAWKIDESAITALADVVTNSTDDQQMCALGLNSSNGDLYAFYGGKSDGSETAGTSINIYYKVSTDDGSAWGSETQLSQSARNYDYLMTFPVFTGNFAAIFESQTSTLDGLLISALLPSAGGGGGSPILGSPIIR
jgi:hypothetical protein